MRQEKDRCGKWLIENHGDAILKLAKVTGFLSCRAAQTELIAPRRLPDGLLEVAFPDRAETDPFLIEIETYADRAIASQLFEDMMLTRMERGVIPDVICVVLRPKGNVQVEESTTETSRHGLGSLGGRWRIVELWKLEASDLLAANDVGLIPWVPLTRFTGPPEQLLRQCRERIDRQAKPSEHEALLTVTSLLTAVVFNDEALLAIFGGMKPMIESPLLNKILNINTRQTMHRSILGVLGARFGPVPEEIGEKLRAIEDGERLDELNSYAALCPDLESFRSRLTNV